MSTVTKIALIAIIKTLLSGVICFGQSIPSYIDTNKLITWLPFTNTSLLNYVDVNNAPFRSKDIWFVADRNNVANTAVYTHGYGNGPLKEESYVDLYHYSSISNTTQFTISAWTKKANEVYGSYFISSSYYNSNLFNPSITTFTGIGCNNDSAYFTFANQRITTYEKIDNNWHHYVAVVNNDSMFLYIDDMLKAKGGVTYWGGSTPGDTGYIIKFIIGYNTNQSVLEPTDANSIINYDGAVDDVAIWSRAITKGEVSEVYNAVDTPKNVSVRDIIHSDPNVSIVPNPAQNIISISSNNIIRSVILFDIRGNILRETKPYDFNLELQLFRLSSGIYFLYIDGNTYRFLKE